MKPDEVVIWERQMIDVEKAVPKCCYTCFDFDDKKNMCTRYNKDIPEEFRGALDQCKLWTRDAF